MNYIEKNIFNSILNEKILNASITVSEISKKSSNLNFH